MNDIFLTETRQYSVDCKCLVQMGNVSKIRTCLIFFFHHHVGWVDKAFESIRLGFQSESDTWRWVVQPNKLNKDSLTLSSWLHFVQVLVPGPKFPNYVWILFIISYA